MDLEVIGGDDGVHYTLWCGRIYIYTYVWGVENDRRGSVYIYTYIKPGYRVKHIW